MLDKFNTHPIPYPGADGTYRYTSDLLSLKHSSETRAPSTSIDARLASISSPLNIKAWSKFLSTHPDKDFRDYILQGIQYGFHIGTFTAKVTVPLEAARSNMHSTKNHPEVIDEYVQQELHQGNFLGPFPPHTAPVVHINRFGVIPKKHQPGKWRLITDLSFPEGASVNSTIDTKLCSLKYITVEEVAKQAVALGRGSLIAKIDIKSAYRLVPVAPRDRHLLGMKWRGNIYVDGMLPFGLRSAPKIFTALADALEWCIAKAGVEVVYHYLDDFAVLGLPDSEQCAQNLHILQSVCKDLGVPLAPEKQAGPSSTIEFLGITIDTVRQELRLPDDKLERLKTLLATWTPSKGDSCTRKELESLLGVLAHACTVIPQGRSFLRNTITLVHGAKKPYHHRRLNKDFLSDLEWWRLFAPHWNGKGIIPKSSSKTIALTSDASGSWGCGAWSGSNWFQLSWDKASANLQIAIKELAPILVAAMIWGHKWEGSTVTAHCDSEAVVYILNSRYSRDNYLMHMLRILFFTEAHFRFELCAKHIPGVLNTSADYLSRNQLREFHISVPHADTHQSHVPPSLLQWLLDPQLDWTSRRWTRKFSSFVNRE